MAKLSRRRTAWASASSLGVTLASFIRANKNLSTGWPDQALSFPLGAVALTTGWKLHHFFLRSRTASQEVVFANCSAEGGLSLGSGAPIAIHFRKSSSTSLSSRGPSFGIRKSSNSCLIVCRRRLSSGFPGTMAGPSLPPFSNPSLKSRISFAFALPELLWHS